MQSVAECVDAETDYHGWDIPKARSKVGSAAACQEKCANLDLCKFWTFNTERKYCYPKTSKVGAKSHVSYAVSGPKICPNSGNMPILFMDILLQIIWKKLTADCKERCCNFV